MSNVYSTLIRIRIKATLCLSIDKLCVKNLHKAYRELIGKICQRAVEGKDIGETCLPVVE